MNNYGNEAAEKKNFKSQENKHKDMEIWDLNHREFKTTALKKLSHTEVNTDG